MARTYDSMSYLLEGLLTNPSVPIYTYQENHDPFSTYWCSPLHNLLERGWVDDYAQSYFKDLQDIGLVSRLEEIAGV